MMLESKGILPPTDAHELLRSGLLSAKIECIFFLVRHITVEHSILESEIQESNILESEIQESYIVINSANIRNPLICK